MGSTPIPPPLSCETVFSAFLIPPLLESCDKKPPHPWMRCLKWGREAGYLWANTGSHEPKSLDFGLVYSQIFKGSKTLFCAVSEMRPATHLHKLWKFGSVNWYSRRKAVSHTTTSVHFFSSFSEKAYILMRARVHTQMHPPHIHTNKHFTIQKFSLLY